MRFSLLTLLVLTAYAAIACMSLVHPDYHWTSLVWNSSVSILVVATVGALVVCGSDRAYWTGFALCGWLHYALTLGPWLGGRLNSYIFTRAVLDFLCVALEHERQIEAIGNGELMSVTPPINFFIYADTKLKMYSYFLISGFAICSVLCGLLGGYLANHLYARLGHKAEPEEPAAGRTGPSGE